MNCCRYRLLIRTVDDGGDVGVRTDDPQLAWLCTESDTQCALVVDLLYLEYACGRRYQIERELHGRNIDLWACEQQDPVSRQFAQPGACCTSNSNRSVRDDDAWRGR